MGGAKRLSNIVKAPDKIWSKCLTGWNTPAEINQEDLNVSLVVCYERLDLARPTKGETTD